MARLVIIRRADSVHCLLFLAKYQNKNCNIVDFINLKEQNLNERQNKKLIFTTILDVYNIEQSTME